MFLAIHTQGSGTSITGTIQIIKFGAKVLTFPPASGPIYRWHSPLAKRRAARWRIARTPRQTQCPTLTRPSTPKERSGVTVGRTRRIEASIICEWFKILFCLLVVR